MVKDPVCGMDVDEKNTKLTSTYNGRCYIFCSISCKATFEKDPNRVLDGRDKNDQGQHESACCSDDSEQPAGCCSEEKNKSVSQKSSCCC